MLKNYQPTTAPTGTLSHLDKRQCSENSDTFTKNIFTADFNVAGGRLHIGKMFESLVDGGNAQKLPGAGEDGSTTVRIQASENQVLSMSLSHFYFTSHPSLTVAALKDDTNTSRIITKPQDVYNFIQVEATFDFKFDGMEASQADMNSPDNVIVEYQLDGGFWLTATTLTMDDSTCYNGIWYSACFQLNVPDSFSLAL
jgi:hypothetical protein